MRSLIATAVLAASVGATAVQAQETSLGWYEDNWEATTFPTDSGPGCTVDSPADNFSPSEGAWIFVHPAFIQFAPNSGLPGDGTGTVVVDAGAPIPLEVFDGAVGYVDDADDLPLLQAMAQGEVMTITVWPLSAPSRTVEYIYPLAGFRDAYQRIADECGFDPSDVLNAAVAPPVPDLVAPAEDNGALSQDSGTAAPSEDGGGSSIFRPRK